MRQSEWQEVTFTFDRVYGHIENSMIMPRECIVGKNQFSATAFKSIREWVQEQAITIGEQSINDTARSLLEIWRHTRQGHDIVFTLLSTTGDVFYCWVEYENDEEERELRNRHPRRIRECRVNKTPRMRISTVRGQIRAWLGAFINDAQSVRDISEDLLPKWDSLQVGGYIVFKFVVPTGNFVFSKGTI